jgi:hypothetical protein
VVAPTAGAVVLVPFPFSPARYTARRGRFRQWLSSYSDTATRQTLHRRPAAPSRSAGLSRRWSRFSGGSDITWRSYYDANLFRRLDGYRARSKSFGHSAPGVPLFRKCENHQGEPCRTSGSSGTY